MGNTNSKNKKEKKNTTKEEEKKDVTKEEEKNTSKKSSIKPINLQKQNETLRELEKMIGKKKKEVIYSSDIVNHEEIRSILMNKRNLLFIMDCEELERVPNYHCVYEARWDLGEVKEVVNRYIMYIEERINYYDNYITHLNTNSFVMVETLPYHERCRCVFSEKRSPLDGMSKCPCNGVSLGSEESKTLLSFKYSKEQTIELNGSVRVKGIIIIQLEGKKEKVEEEKVEQAVQPLDQHSMIVISKYLKFTKDYINIEKTSKKYSGLIEQLHFNPIPFTNDKEMEIFKNIETYNLYESGVSLEVQNTVLKNAMRNGSKIQNIIHWENVSYSKWKVNKTDKDIYKSVEIRNEDVIKYFVEHEERKERQENQDSSEEYFTEEIFTCLSGSRTTTLKEKVELEEGITRISDGCFEYCSNLRTITIPSSVTLIEDGCFYGCCQLKGNVTINSNNLMYRTDGTDIYRIDNSKVVDIYSPSETQRRRLEILGRVSECVKPVILLYNEEKEEETDFEITLKLNDAMDIGSTYPKPNISKEDVKEYLWKGKYTSRGKENCKVTVEGKEYEYVFWEGVCLNKEAFRGKEIGIRKERIESELEELLIRLGLNERERNDFIVYWLIKLSKMNNVKVTICNSEYDTTIAPMKVKGFDKIHRVMMKFESVDSIEGLESVEEVERIERPTGKYVIEWGGVY